MYNNFDVLRYDIINHLIRKNGFGKYLEIGVRNPNDCFNKILCDTKHSLDPCIEVDADVNYKLTSDTFFDLLDGGNLNLPFDYTWDVIFIDGLHISNQVDMDISNSLNHLSENGVIVLHDCNPPLLSHAREDFHDISTPAGGNWNGTVWKAFYKYRSTREDLEMATINTDWGVGIIKKGSQVCCTFDNPYFEYRKFELNREYYLNLISVDEFFEKY
jgi:hypothetical protein